VTLSNFTSHNLRVSSTEGRSRTATPGVPLGTRKRLIPSSIVLPSRENRRLAWRSAMNSTSASFAREIAIGCSIDPAVQWVSMPASEDAANVHATP